MQKKIGILGFGVVGKSALNFLQNFKQNKKKLNLKHLNTDLESVKLDVWDQNQFDDQVGVLKIKDIDLFDSAKVSMKDFIEQHDLIIPSPGINLNDFYSARNKFVCELDIFSSYFKKPIVAITGSLGKTTTTTLLGILLSKIKRAKLDNFKPFVGGNIGLGMLEAIEKQDAYDVGVLELSSFQLEFSRYFAPDLAILMNCYPNHLDRHKSFEDYFDAKFNLFKYQTERQFALFPWNILNGDVGSLFCERVTTLKSNLCFVSDSPVDHQLPVPLKPYKIFYKQDNKLVLFDSSNKLITELFDLSVLPEITFIQNWLLIISGLYLLDANLIELQEFFEQNCKTFTIDDLHHRVEHFATIRGVKFYDDSKATVIQSTLAAVKSLANKGPIILILGGLNKGVDRSPIIPELAKIRELKKIYCYGPACSDFGVVSCNFNSLEEIVQDIAKIMQPADHVLFSPSGTSFDFYKNYKHRGQVFKELVLSLNKN